MDVTFIVKLQPQVHIQDKHLQFTHITSYKSNNSMFYMILQQDECTNLIIQLSCHLSCVILRSSLLVWSIVMILKVPRVVLHGEVRQLGFQVLSLFTSLRRWIKSGIISMLKNFTHLLKSRTSILLTSSWHLPIYLNL
jgi:hypothetical protein